MVFILKEIISGKQILLASGRNYTLGRNRDNKIVLTDKSVSKEHAFLRVQDGVATIEDLGSKRGTFINDIPLVVPTDLRDQDVIHFGLHNCKYIFLDPKWLTAVDRNITGLKRSLLKKKLTQYDVKFCAEYNESCTHLTIEKISLTNINFLNALVDKKCIVTVKFWLDLENVVNSVSEIPNLMQYIPEIDKILKNKGIEHIFPRLSRRFLFDDKLFIFFEQKYKHKYEDIIRKCDGAVMLYQNDPKFLQNVCAENYTTYIIVENQSKTAKNIEKDSFIKQLKKETKYTVMKLKLEDILVCVLKASFDNYCENRNHLLNESGDTIKKDLSEDLPFDAGKDIDIAWLCGSEKRKKGLNSIARGSKIKKITKINPFSIRIKKENQIGNYAISKTVVKNPCALLRYLKKKFEDTEIIPLQ